jgi:hypothetical protein
MKLPNLHKRTTPEKEQRAVENFNRVNSVGALVRYQRDDGTLLETRTQSLASMLSEHTAVIWLNGVSGCVSLHRVRPIVRL